MPSTICLYAEALIEAVLISCALQQQVGLFARGPGIAKVGSAVGLWWQASQLSLKCAVGKAQVLPAQGPQPQRDHCPGGWPLQQTA